MSPAFGDKWSGYNALCKLETKSQRAVLKRVAYDAECTYLACVLHVCTNAGTGIIIAHTYNAQRLACIGRQLAQVDTLGYIVTCHELNGYRQMLCDDLVHAAFNIGNLLLCGCTGQVIVTLAFLTLDMCITATLAPEHPHHSLVKDVLYGMHRRVFRLVMVIELWCFHCHSFYSQFPSVTPFPQALQPML